MRRVLGTQRGDYLLLSSRLRKGRGSWETGQKKARRECAEEAKGDEFQGKSHQAVKVAEVKQEEYGRVSTEQFKSPLHGDEQIQRNCGLEARL